MEMMLAVAPFPPEDITTFPLVYSMLNCYHTSCLHIAQSWCMVPPEVLEKPPCRKVPLRTMVWLHGGILWNGNTEYTGIKLRMSDIAGLLLNTNIDTHWKRYAARVRDGDIKYNYIYSADISCKAKLFTCGILQKVTYWDRRQSSVNNM